MTSMVMSSSPTTMAPAQGDEVILCCWKQAGEETINDLLVGAYTFFRIIKVGGSPVGALSQSPCQSCWSSRTQGTARGRRPQGGTEKETDIDVILMCPFTQLCAWFYFAGVVLHHFRCIIASYHSLRLWIK